MVYSFFISASAIAKLLSLVFLMVSPAPPNSSEFFSRFSIQRVNSESARRVACTNTEAPLGLDDVKASAWIEISKSALDFLANSVLRLWST